MAGEERGADGRPTETVDRGRPVIGAQRTDRGRLVNGAEAGQHRVAAMAEAHSAVAFSFSVSHEGVDLNYDHEMLGVVLMSGVRSWRRRIHRFFNGFRNGIYPVPLSSLGLTVATVGAMYYAGYDGTGGLTDFFMRHAPRLVSAEEHVLKAVSVTAASTTIWLSVALALKYTLRLLFMYRGWMYETRTRKMSLKTKIWYVLVKILTSISRPQLYSFQGCLPSLPLPSVEDTTKRYLRSVRPLLDDAEYERMVKLTEEFRTSLGPRLQRYLWLKSWWTTNYVSDWWEEYVYLRGRSGIMVNSNFYGIDAILMQPSTIQAARAANITHATMLFRRAIDRQEIEPITVQGMVPLCSWQYERTFNTTRVPGIETDRIVHYSDSTHIVVIHNGKYYKMQVYDIKKRLMSPATLEMQFQRILDDDETTPDKGEEQLGALTAADRSHWYLTRRDFFSRGTNRASLLAIEKAAFIVCLDDVDLEFDKNDHTKLDEFGRWCLHGNGCNRWYDKSLNLIVGRNGRIGFNGEHSWADAPIMSHYWEYVLAADVIREGYTESGHTIGEADPDAIPPVKLRWDLKRKCLDAIDRSYREAQLTLDDVDLRLLMHDAFGKGFMKKCKVSPDAFIQMALQLAYYRDSGRFRLTYEASMTRLFREGRTETVRPCTIESSAWVKAMTSGKVDRAEQIRLFRAACDFHQRGYQDAMMGKGIDRHLFCLYVVSKYLEVDSPFLKEVLSEPWRLSTSQTPHGQTNLLDLKKHPGCVSAGGGFGPVADDGYGVSYIIAGEDIVFFHVSSKKSSADTDSNRLAGQIQRALADIRTMFEQGGQ
ncbi:carnitine O-palmitoyltransferase 1, liver isoform-like isoform X2 [Amphibalanus amphitrite]|uniref:carnitine O-palmitoyltransferase 1, liver isoform-like isoform X2 n=2 Tax=Amphibalanus amphitrite TaxID=1232801 RepID=UPI001C924436|nr:carnitine O-palmitoyltransferase 1, liver isoform-like isoform X2 [Amphibalanus amphitrite]